MLEAFADRIWIAEGPDVNGLLGFRFPTRMAVIRLRDRALFVWSPVKLTQALREALAALGEIRFLAAPNHLHHLFLGEWKDAFPSAQIHAAPGVMAKRPDLRIDHELCDHSPDAWGSEIEQVEMRGNLITTEIVFFHHASGTVLFTDLLQQMPRDRFSGWRAVVARLDGMVGNSPAVPRKFRMAFRNRPALRDAISRIRQWPVERVLMAHGEPVRHGGREIVEQAFAWAD